MKIRISSSLTHLAKLLWIPFAVLGGIATVQMVASEDGAAGWLLRGPELVGILVFIVAVWWIPEKFKQVEMDDRGVTIIGNRQIISIPYSKIRAIKNSWLARWQINISFIEPTPMGKEISFIAEFPSFAWLNPFWCLREHPIATDLKRRVTDANEGDRVGAV